ncbi:MAG: aldo/keto reductase [Planctomycetales bacterium]|nr:aldo/keto reductase [Planctomycetales bacterium]
MTSKFGFGTGSLHHLPRKQARVSLLRLANEIGITHFDTAPLYGYGLAEASIGEAFQGRRQEVTIATKIGLYPRLGMASSSSGMWIRKSIEKFLPSCRIPKFDWSRQQSEKSLKQSLNRLRTDYVDVLFVHEPHDRITNLPDLLEWLERKVTQGDIREFGVAGPPQSVKPYIGHKLGNVIQTRNSFSNGEASFLGQNGRELQFTYGYHRGEASPCWRKLVRLPLSGVIVFSSRRKQRILALESAIRC